LRIWGIREIFAWLEKAGKASPNSFFQFPIPIRHFCAREIQKLKDCFLCCFIVFSSDQHPSCSYERVQLVREYLIEIQKRINHSKDLFYQAIKERTILQIKKNAGIVLF
jgi:hypothetical protein